MTSVSRLLDSRRIRVHAPLCEAKLLAKSCGKTAANPQPGANQPRMDLAAFRDGINGYRRLTGHSQQELARELGLHPDVLSHKLHATDGAVLHHADVRGIVRVLAAWHALTMRAQAVHLLGLMDLGPHTFSTQEWDAPPLNTLEEVSGGTQPLITD